MFRELLLTAGLLAVQTGAPPSPAPTPVSKPSSAPQRLAFATQAARQYRFVTGPDRKSPAELHAQPLLRWDNQVVREDDGMLFLWTGKGGRPLVAAQFFLQGDAWHHEFQSLSGDGFEAAHKSVKEWTWHPKAAGLRWTAADETDPPAATAAARLRQMRAVAEKYSGTVDVDRSGTSANTHELRLLTTPIYRYAAEDTGLVDGAIFAFVQGTNPEVLLILEARRQSDQTQWYVGFAPMTSFHLRVRHGEQVVFERALQSVPTLDLDSPYHFRWIAEKDSSAEWKTEAE